MIGYALFVLLAFAVAVIVYAPDTEVGRTLHGALVLAPARLLNGGPLKIFVAVIVFAGLVVFAVGAPEFVALVGMTDLSVYLDLVVLSFVLGAVAKLRTVGQRAILATRRALDGWRVGRIHRRQTRTRAPRVGKPRGSLADEDGWPSNAWAPASAA